MKAKPKVLRVIRDAKYYEKKGHTPENFMKKKHKKKSVDPIAHAHRESSKSPKKMFKESMEHLHKLSKKSKP